MGTLRAIGKLFPSPAPRVGLSQENALTAILPTIAEPIASLKSVQLAVLNVFCVDFATFVRCNTMKGGHDRIWPKGEERSLTASEGSAVMPQGLTVTFRTVGLQTPMESGVMGKAIDLALEDDIDRQCREQDAERRAKHLK